MIGTIRKSIQKRGAKIILWLTLLSLAGGSFITFFRFSRRFGAQSIGQVNDQEIGINEYRRKFVETQHIMQEIRKLYGPQADMILAMWGLNKKPDEFVLENLISEKLFQSAANQLGVVVSKEYLQSKLNDPLFVREFLSGVIPPQAMVSGSIDPTVLKYALQQQGISEEEFESMLNDTMRRVLLQNLIQAAVYVPRSALKDAYKAQNLKKKFVILKVPLKDYLLKDKALEGELEQYFDKHKEEYRIPEKRSAKVWSFDVDTYGVNVSDKDLQDAYNKKKFSFIEKPEEYSIQHILLKVDNADKEKRVEIRKQAQELLKKAKEKPEAFEELAKQHSQSKDKGNTVVLKKDNYTLERAVAKLQPNEIGLTVFETPEGFEIVKLISKKEATYKPLEKVKDSLIKSIKQEKFATEFNTTAQRIVSQAKDLPELFKKFIEERKGKESALTDVIRDPSIAREHLFGLSAVGDKAFYEDEGKGYLVELTTVVPSSIPAFSAVKEKVEKDMSRARAKEALKNDLAAISAKLKESKEAMPASVSKLTSAKVDISDTDWIDPKNVQDVKKYEEKKLPVHAMLALTKPLSTTQEITDDGAVIAQLKEIEPFNEGEFEKAKGALESQVRQTQSNALQSAYVDSLRSHAKIDINKDLMRYSGR